MCQAILEVINNKYITFTFLFISMAPKINKYHHVFVKIDMSLCAHVYGWFTSVSSSMELKSFNSKCPQGTQSRRLMYMHKDKLSINYSLDSLVLEAGR